jgi:hypothetical protein
MPVRTPIERGLQRHHAPRQNSGRTDQQNVAGSVIEHKPSGVANRGGAEVRPPLCPLPCVNDDQPAAETRGARDHNLLWVPALLVRVNAEPRPLGLKASFLQRGGGRGRLGLVDELLGPGRGSRKGRAVWRGRRRVGWVVPRPVKKVLQDVTRASVDDVEQV